MAFTDRIVEHPNRIQLVPVSASTYSTTGDGTTTVFDIGVSSPTITGVTIDGTATSAYTLSGSEVTFASAPADGAEIIISFTASGMYDIQRAEGFVTEIGTPLKAEELTTNIRELISAATEGLEIQNDGDVYFQNLQRGYAQVQGAANAVTSMAVTFPTTFTSVPRVAVTPHTSRPDQVFASVGNITRTGFTLYVFRPTASATGVSWIATI